MALTDFPLGISGVGNQANILISKLIETGKYSFKVLGGAIKHQNYNTIQVNEDYVIKPIDGFGNRDIVVSLLLQEQFDAVFIFTDPRQYIWLWEMEDEIKQVCPIVYWHVWDNDPYPKFNNTWYKGTELLNCISWKTYEMVKPHFPEKTNYIPHAWPKDMYFKMQDQQVSALKSQFFGPKSNWFMPIWVNRNAHRKMPNDLLMGWKMFLDLLEEREGHRNAALIMHTNPTDIEGPNLQEVVNELGLRDNVAFSINPLNHNEMNQLYNMSDCVVNISKAEGLGLSILTGLQIGKPVIGLKTGGMTRQLIDYRDGFEHGVALEPVERSLIGSQMVPYIYEDIVGKKDLAEAFYKVYKYTPEEKELIGKRSMEYVNFEMNLDNVVAEWNRTLEDTIIQFKNGKFPLWELVPLDRKDSGSNNKKEIATKTEVKSKFIINQPKGRK